MAKPEPEIISRTAAYMQSRKRFYTGDPCANGHTSERYVSNGACIECLTGKFKQRRNVFCNQLQPYASSRFWTPKNLTAQELKGLEPYLQRCIMEYTRHCGKLNPELEEGFLMQLERM